jgi:hypothetical protein
MISFRLSPEEHRMVQNACGPKGARSISDLARKATLQFMAARGEWSPLSDALRDIQERVRQISLELERIAPRVGASKSRGEGTTA